MKLFCQSASLSVCCLICLVCPLTHTHSINHSPTPIHPPTHRLTRTRAHTHTRTRFVRPSRTESRARPSKPTNPSQPNSAQPSRARRRRLLLLLLLLGYILTVRMCMTDRRTRTQTQAPIQILCCHMSHATHAMPCHPHAPGPGPAGRPSLHIRTLCEAIKSIPPGRASLSLLMDPTLVPMPPV